ncbi:AMP-binding protein [Streptomyces sp. NPDC059506]|uniref:AMP-binding protein n=1 Tax=Streptomyces TaxID=1883 RepID=UPI0015F93526|nr:AMP-binding protein [Streptomyces sp. SCUT-3]QMV23408.1 AMP-binding protein [Streptomyces sp. SCUT-3]
MTFGESGLLFRQARDTLLRHREDLEAARREFTWPRPKTFNWALDWFDPMARGNHRTALRVVGEGADTELTFSQVSRRSDRVANWLRGHGVRRGDPVLVVLDNRPALWETVLAAIKLGAVVVPTYSTATPAELADRLTRARVRHVVAEASLAPRFEGLPGRWSRIAVGGAPQGWSDYRDASAAPADFRPDADTPATDPLFCYFTSGTTSLPKMVVHTHLSYPVGHLSGMYWNGLRPGDVHLNISAPGWAKHAWSSFFVPWNAEAQIVALPAERSAPQHVLEVLASRGVTTFCAPPSVWRALTRHGIGPRPPELREATSAGEPLDPQVFAEVADAWGIEIRDGYGQTETTGQIGTPPGRPVVPGRMGWALPGYRPVVLHPETLAPVPPGEAGELCIDLSDSPAGVMAGYDGDERRTAAAFAGGHYHTGDLVVAEEDGGFRYLGRADDMFKSFDHRISPLELERVLLAHPAVADAAVVPHPHPVGQWVAKAFVVPAESRSGDGDTAAEVFDHLDRELPPEKRVHLITFTDRLPRTVSGKVRRVELRERTGTADFHRDRPAAPVEPVGPAASAESAVSAAPAAVAR